MRHRLALLAALGIFLLISCNESPVEPPIQEPASESNAAMDAGPPSFLPKPNPVGCEQDQVAKWDAASGEWVCANDETSSATRVAFNVEFDGRANFSRNDPVPFNTVNLNDGHVFDGTSSFTIPIDGVYQLTINYGGHGNGWLEHHGTGERVVSALAGFNSVTVELSAGDVLSAHCYTYTYYCSGYPNIRVSGHLVYTK